MFKNWYPDNEKTDDVIVVIIILLLLRVKCMLKACTVHGELN